MDEAQARQVKELESSKERLIRDYLELQDQADDLNGRIYNLCCEIESLNRQIDQLREKTQTEAPSAPPATQTPRTNQIPPLA